MIETVLLVPVRDNDGNLFPRSLWRDQAMPLGTVRPRADMRRAALERMMDTFVTLEGRVLDLTRLSDEERTFFGRCYLAYRNGTPWESFVKLSRGPQNPVIQAAGGRITQAVWEHPLFQALHDLEDRLGIQQGELAADPGDDLARDPVADTWIPAVEAARAKGVTLPGLHGAIKRGVVVAKPAESGRPRLLVSANSLARWTPNPVRQAARRASHKQRVA
ncbi:MAG: hypothetical protein HY332_07710 [Chloroflexi bacterium]|nr:hypothetical protein [Chloroflexota bacterium]